MVAKRRSSRSAWSLVCFVPITSNNSAPWHRNGISQLTQQGPSCNSPGLESFILHPSSSRRWFAGHIPPFSLSRATCAPFTLSGSNRASWFALSKASRAARFAEARREAALRAANKPFDENFFSCLRVTTRAFGVAISNSRSSITARLQSSPSSNKCDEARGK